MVADAVINGAYETANDASKAILYQDRHTVPPSTIRMWVTERQVGKLFGDVLPLRTGRPARKATPEVKEAVRKMLSEDNGLYYRKVAAKLVKEGYPQMSPAYVGKIAREMGWTEKLVTRHQEYAWFKRETLVARKRWLDELEANPDDERKYVFIDESYFAPSRLSRRRGKALHGERPTMTGSRSGKTLYLTLAVTPDTDLRGPQYSVLFPSMSDTTMFQSFVTGLLGKLGVPQKPDTLPEGVEPYILWYDNASFHHTAMKNIRALYGENVVLRPTAPSSPDLHPIEQLFAIIKKRAESVDDIRYTGRMLKPEALHARLSRAVAQTCTGELTASCLRHSKSYYPAVRCFYPWKSGNGAPTTAQLDVWREYRKEFNNSDTVPTTAPSNRELVGWYRRNGLGTYATMIERALEVARTSRLPPRITASDDGLVPPADLIPLFGRDGNPAQVTYQRPAGEVRANTTVGPASVAVYHGPALDALAQAATRRTELEEAQRLAAAEEADARRVADAQAAEVRRLAAERRAEERPARKRRRVHKPHMCRTCGKPRLGHPTDGRHWSPAAGGWVMPVVPDPVVGDVDE